MFGESRTADEQSVGRMIRMKATYVVRRLENHVILNAEERSTPIPNAPIPISPAASKDIVRGHSMVFDTVQEDQPPTTLDIDPTDDQPGDEEFSDGNDSDEGLPAAPTSDVDPLSSDALKRRVAESKAFDDFRARFWRTVFPSPLQGIDYLVRRVTSGSQSFMHTITINVSWDLSAFLKTEFDHMRKSDMSPMDLRKILTVSGTSLKAFATTAGEYAAWKWPLADIDVLSYINTMMELTQGAKSSSPCLIK